MQSKRKSSFFTKKNCGKARIPYDDAVEEAICFGWIDSTVKRIYDETFMQKFTPRKNNSYGRNPIKTGALKMIKKRKMTKYGYEKFISQALKRFDEALHLLKQNKKLVLKKINIQ